MVPPVPVSAPAPDGAGLARSTAAIGNASRRVPVSPWAVTQTGVWSEELESA